MTQSRLAGTYRATSRQGFTLIELLVVMGIILVLAGMIMPMFGIIQRNSMRSRTEFTEKKVDGALRLFKAEWGVFPYQMSYPDMSPGSRFPNNLYYRIGTDVSSGDRAKVIADMDSAGGLFAYKCTMTTGSDGNVGYNDSTQGSTFAFTWTKVSVPFTNIFLNDTDLNGGEVYGIPAVLNQGAQEQARLAMVAGNINKRGPFICANATTVSLNQTTQVLLSSPQSAGNPGMAVDYLKGEIDARSVSGTDILDAWHNPLIYINQCIPGMQGVGGIAWGFQVPCYDSRYMGFGPIGFDPTTGPGQSLISGGRPLLLFNGRVRLTNQQAGDGLGPTPIHATYFPSSSSLRNSDVRYYAAPGYETEFELWSAGADKSFSYMRNEDANRDNVAILQYNRGL